MSQAQRAIPRFTELSDLEPAAPGLREIRQHIHHHPELAYEELQTGALVAEKLEQWGWQVTRGVGETGVVGHAEGGRRHAQHRHSRGHGRAAHRRADRPAVRQRHPRQDARVRP